MSQGLLTLSISSPLVDKILRSFLNPSIVLCPVPPAAPVHSNTDCTNLSYFVDKVAAVRSGTIPSSSPLPACPNHQSVMSFFQPISLHDLAKSVSSTKYFSSHLDTLPTSMWKDVISSVDPCLVSIINSSLEFSHAPTFYKQAVVQPLFKKI